MPEDHHEAEVDTEGTAQRIVPEKPSCYDEGDVFASRKNPPAWYHTLYLVLWVALGVLLSFVLHALVELWYLASAEKAGTVDSLVWTKYAGLGSCALPAVVQYGLFGAGLIGGFLLGRVWWRLVYVERRWERKEDPATQS